MGETTKVVSKLERDILEYISKGDRDSAISLVMEHYSYALRIIANRYVIDDDLTEDVLSEAYIKIWKNFNSYDSSKFRLYTWLVKIVKNASIDHIRRRDRIRLKEVRDFNKNHEDDTLFSIIEKNSPVYLKVDDIGISDMLKEIKKDYAFVLWCIFFKGLTHIQISEDYSIPLGTVKSRYKIGLRELKNIFSKRELSLLN